MPTLIFDFDGTLADSFRLVVGIAYRLTGITPLSHKEEERLRGLPLMQIRKELKIPLRRLPKLVIKGRQEMNAHISDIKPFEGVAQVLAELRNSGYRLLVISSNSEQNVREFLRANGLEEFFDGVHGGVGIFDKAAALRKVLRRSHLNKDEGYYIGDEVRDVAAAKKVGLRAISVSWGYQLRSALEAQKPFAIADKPKDLPLILAAKEL